MGGCCNRRGCDEFFGTRFASRTAKRYRKRGLDKTADQIVRFVEGPRLADASVLEIGGGLGEIQLELLKRGAARAVNLELSPAYDPEAGQLAREAALDGRIERRLHDIALDPAGVEPADIVVLNRVVCCYPDYQRLLGAAADHARHVLVFSHPPRNPISRLIVAAQNAGFRLMRREFRVFVHPPDAMIAVVERRGLRHTFTHRRLIWRVAGLQR
jgi:hypothetical protein